MSEIEHRFAYHPPQDAETVLDHEWVRGQLGELALELADLLPSCREASLAVTKLEEAMFWANAAVAREPRPLVDVLAPAGSDA